MENARGRSIWKVGESAVVQPLSDLAVPSPVHLVEPVRRIGTYQGATNRISMLPVIRDGRALMLSMDSELELAWARASVMHPDTETLYAQPMMLVWEHDEGSIVHVPDLAAIVGGRLVVLEVKPAARLVNPWIEVRTGLAKRSLARAGVDYYLLSDMTRQRSHNLGYLSGHRRWNPFLAAEFEVGVRSEARSIGGLIEAICRARAQSATTTQRFGVGTATPLVDVDLIAEVDDSQTSRIASIRIAIQVVASLLANGHFYTDLDQPLRLSSVLTRQHPSIASWSRW